MKNRILRGLFSFGLPASLGMVLLATSVQADDPKLTVQSSIGLTQVTLTADEGQIVLYLPSDLVPGETISGTLMMKSDGKNEKEKQKNLEKLAKEYPLHVGDKIVTPVASTLSLSATCFDGEPIPDVDVILEQIPIVVIDGVPTIVAPKQTKGPVKTEGKTTNPKNVCTKGTQFFGTIPVILTNEKFTKILSRVDLKIYAEPYIRRISTPSVFETVSGDQPTTIFGPFDGDSRNNQTFLDGVQTEILAESPRQISFSAAGVLESGLPRLIELVESGRRVGAESNLFRVEIHTPGKVFKKNDVVPVTVTVSGLKGLDQPLTITFFNASPQIGHLERGDEVEIVIQPSQVDAQGRFVYSDRFKFMTSGIATLATKHDAAKTAVRNMK